MTFTWNIVTRNFRLDAQLRKKLRQRTAKLETHLKHFPPDAVHLQVSFERHPKKPLHTSTLNLRLPSNILHSEKTAADAITAFDHAVKALLRELETLKSALRGERFWKRKERRKQLHQLKAAKFAIEPQAQGAGPQKIEDLIRDFFRQHFDRLLHHARRHIRHDEMSGEI